MGTIKIPEMLLRFYAVVKDDQFVRWQLSEAQDLLNDAYKEIVGIKPSANTLIAPFTCAVGTTQALTLQFPRAVRLVDVTRNLAGTSDGRAVTRIDRSILDGMRPGWHAETPSDTISYFVFDVRVPGAFWTYPPASANAQLEVAYAALPEFHTLGDASLMSYLTTETIRLDDSYSNAILEYMLYRAFMKDAEYASNEALARAHYQSMLTSLGVRKQTEVAEMPESK